MTLDFRYHDNVRFYNRNHDIEPGDDFKPAYAFLEGFGGENAMRRFAEYEAHLSRAFNRACRELRAMRKARPEAAAMRPGSAMNTPETSE